MNSNCHRAVAIAAGLVLLGSAARAESVLVSPWSETMSARARMIVGAVEHAGQKRLAAGVEVDIADDWKTYWRSPGDAGGVPPVFDWSGSTNLARADVLFPAPRVLTDKAGNTLGYKGPVVFPVLVDATEPGKPMTLELKLEYGVCREICIPAEAHLLLEVPSAQGIGASPRLQAALDQVPRPQNALLSPDPRLRRAVAMLDGPAAKLTIEAAFPGDTSNARILVEAPDGLFVPLPRKVAERDGVVTFEADLASGIDASELRGKTLRLTLIGAAGHSEADVKVD